MENPASYDPDETTPPGYDDRAPFVVRVVDPVHAKRGRNNRARGQRAELALDRTFTAAGWTVYRQGGVGRRDMVISKGDLRYSVEVKTHQGRLLPSHTRLWWAQAIRQAGRTERPLLVVKVTSGTSKALWWVATPDGQIALNLWLAE